MHDEADILCNDEVNDNTSACNLAEKDVVNTRELDDGVTKSFLGKGKGNCSVSSKADLDRNGTCNLVNGEDDVICGASVDGNSERNDSCIVITGKDDDVICTANSDRNGSPRLTTEGNDIIFTGSGKTKQLSLEIFEMKS